MAPPSFCGSRCCLCFLSKVRICGMIRLSFCQEGMDAGVAPLLLRSTRPVARAPGRQPPIVHLFDIGKGNTSSLCLCRQALRLGKPAGKPCRIFRCLCLNTLVCREDSVRRRVLVRHGFASPDFLGSTRGFTTREPCKVFIGAECHSTVLC